MAPIDTLPVVADLKMDRSKPLGNSEGADDRGRLHVKVANKLTEAIPVTVTDSEPGDPFFFDAQSPSTPGAEQTLIAHVVPPSSTLFLTQVVISSRFSSKTIIRINGLIVGSILTSSSNPTQNFEWNPRRAASSGDLVEVVFTQVVGTPIMDVEAHLMGLMQT